MASDAPHKQEFRIRDLTTRSVLLFPTRAQIIRDIKEITLQPGPNQIIIDGLAPTVDEHSTKVEGTGSATISEVSVDLLSNREVYEDIYPSESEEEDDDDDEDESETEDEGMKTITEKIKKLNVRLLEEQEKINSAAQRLEICDKFGKSVEKDRPEPKDLEALVKAYQDERTKIYQDHEAATGQVESIKEDIAKCNKEKMKLAKALVKATEKAKKEKAKLREKKLRKKAEIYKEKQRIKAERESFWPKKVYRVTINLEPSSLTPSSSRRSSVDGDTIVNVAPPNNLATTTFHETPSTPLKTGEISLSLSYITYSASWSPRYDLALNTVKCTGLLEYGASLVNTTSETWANAKIILSTSQTTFSGLSEEIPVLSPWHVRLLKGGRNDNSALFSQSELSAKQKEWSQTTGANTQSQKPRWENFGRDDSTRNRYLAEEARQKEHKKRNVEEKATALFSSHSVPQPQMFGNLSQQQAAPAASASFGAPRGRFGGSSMPKRSHERRSQYLDVEAEIAEDDDGSDEDMGFGLFDDGTPAPKSLTFEEGAWEETGLTTTYDVPGFKTLAPSHSTTKHKIAKIEFKNIIFSHIIIGKLRQVAFLKARLRNMSRITLLKGPLGLTLDGSFLGSATFPRCSAGESFSLPLGVDPSLTAAYQKPTVRRSQTGIFSKEDNNVFTRMITLINTKHNASVECTVLDQVPVSEDERLKIEVLSPRGLKVGGEGVKTGIAVANASAGGATKGTAKDVRASVYGTEGLAKDGKWGSAVATGKKGGEVSWNVKLNPGQGVKLVLEYEAAFPGGEMVVGV